MESDYGQAKRLGETANEWLSLECRFHLLMEVLGALYLTFGDFRLALANTGQALIVHPLANPIWGSGTKKEVGQNLYGRALMLLRASPPAQPKITSIFDL